MIIVYWAQTDPTPAARGWIGTLTLTLHWPRLLALTWTLQI